MEVLIHLFSKLTIGRPMVSVSKSRYGFSMAATPTPSPHDDPAGSAEPWACAEADETHVPASAIAANRLAFDGVDMLESFGNCDMVKSLIWNIGGEGIRVAEEVSRRPPDRRGHRRHRMCSESRTTGPAPRGCRPASGQAAYPNRNRDAATPRCCR